MSHGDELVGDSAHGGDDDGDLMPFLVESFYAMRDVADAIKGAD